MYLGAALAGVWFGSWQEKNIWQAKSKSHTRKECRGNLYWVIEDEDLEKLCHVNECMKDSK